MGTTTSTKCPLPPWIEIIQNFYLAVIFIQSTESNFPEAEVKNPMQGSLGYLNQTIIDSQWW